MARSRPNDRAGHPLRAAIETPTLSAPAPLPFYHHPVVALSLVLIAACVAQLIVWLASMRLPSGGLGPASGPAAHGYLFTTVESLLHRLVSHDRFEPALFAISMGTALLSAGGWYAVARVGIGPAWGLWTALLWVMHPSFAFVAPRPGPLALMMPLTAGALALLLCWRRSRNRMAALLAGAALGLLGLTGFQGMLLAPLAFAAMLAAGHDRRAGFSGGLLMALGFGLTLAAAGALVSPSFRAGEAVNRLRENWPRSLDESDSIMARAARLELLDRNPAETASPAGFLLGRLWVAPGDTLGWLARRAWRSIYATFNGRLQRPVFMIQMIFLVPAFWGAIVALRTPPWRWTAVMGGLFVGVFWLLAGVIEPLARNLAPIGGMQILFALIGAADVYERARGRRLHSSPDEIPTPLLY